MIFRWASSRRRPSRSTIATLTLDATGANLTYGATTYQYSVASDLAAFNTATGATNTICMELTNWEFIFPVNPAV